MFIVKCVAFFSNALKRTSEEIKIEEKREKERRLKNESVFVRFV
jgi:uncharacterized protein YqgV (UPF0045/DUF77 family)